MRPRVKMYVIISQSEIESLDESLVSFQCIIGHFFSLHESENISKCQKIKLQSYRMLYESCYGYMNKAHGTNLPKIEFGASKSSRTGTHLACFVQLHV